MPRRSGPGAARRRPPLRCPSTVNVRTQEAAQVLSESHKCVRPSARPLPWEGVTARRPSSPPSPLSRPRRRPSRHLRRLSRATLVTRHVMTRRVVTRHVIVSVGHLAAQHADHVPPAPARGRGVTGGGASACPSLAQPAHDTRQALMPLQRLMPSTSPACLGLASPCRRVRRTRVEGSVWRASRPALRAVVSEIRNPRSRRNAVVGIS